MSIRDEEKHPFRHTRPRQEQKPPILRDGLVPGSTTALASDDNGFRHSAPGRSTRQNRISPASPALRSETTSLFPAPRTGSTVRLASTFQAGRRGCTQQRFSDRSVSPPAPTARTSPADRIRPKRPTPRRPSLGNGRLLARPFRENAAVRTSSAPFETDRQTARSPTRTSPKKTQRHERRKRFAFLRPASEDRRERFCKIFSRNRPDLFAANYFLLIFVPAIRNGSVA